MRNILGYDEWLPLNEEHDAAWWKETLENIDKSNKELNDRLSAMKGKRGPQFTKERAALNAGIAKNEILRKLAHQKLEASK